MKEPFLHFLHCFWFCKDVVLLDKDCSYTVNEYNQNAWIWKIFSWKMCNVLRKREFSLIAQFRSFKRIIGSWSPWLTKWQHWMLARQMIFTIDILWMSFSQKCFEHVCRWLAPAQAKSSWPALTAMRQKRLNRWKCWTSRWLTGLWPDFNPQDPKP